MKISKVELKAMKTFMGMDCPGFNANLYINGKKAGMVINDGGGGPTLIHWQATKNPTRKASWYEDAFMAWCKDHPAAKAWVAEHGDDGWVGIDEIVIDAMLDELETQKYMKRQLRTKVLYRRPGEKYEDGQWHMVKHDGKVGMWRARIIEKFGADVVFA